METPRVPTDSTAATVPPIHATIRCPSIPTMHTNRSHTCRFIRLPQRSLCFLQISLPHVVEPFTLPQPGVLTTATHGYCVRASHLHINCHYQPARRRARQPSVANRQYSTRVLTAVVNAERDVGRYSIDWICPFCFLIRLVCLPSLGRFIRIPSLPPDGTFYPFIVPNFHSTMRFGRLQFVTEMIIIHCPLITFFPNSCSSHNNRCRLQKS